jgi:hypothetical protein
MNLRGSLAVALGVLGAACASSASPEPLVPPVSVHDLDQVASKHIFFGHQSVGFNILEGVTRVSKASGRPLSLYETKGAELLPASGWVHTRIGANTDPEGKLRDFTARLDGPVGGWADIAFFKFCYVDFDGDVDPERLFQQYREALDALAQRHPHVAFVQVTAPLTAVPRGLGPTLKHWLGRPVWGEAENARRARFNDLLRKAYGDRGTLFDLAALESRAPDGTQEDFDFRGQHVPALSRSATTDGGHLNAKAADRIAAELLRFLAKLPGRS